MHYPKFEGNYGNLFDLPTPKPTGDACWLQVNNQKGEQKQIALEAKRHLSGSGYKVNQFHVNLPATYLPTEARIYCRHNDVTKELARQTFSGVRPEMADAAIVGKEAGFSAVKAEELSWINSELISMEHQAVMLPSSRLAGLLELYTVDNLLSELHGPAHDVLLKIKQQAEMVTMVERLFVRGSHTQPSDDDKNAIVEWLKQNSQLDGADKIPVPNGLIAQANGDICMAYDADTRAVSKVAACSPAAAEQQWYMGSMGNSGTIRPTHRPELCLTGAFLGHSVVLSGCVSNNNNQKWVFTEGKIKTPAGACLDSRTESGVMTYRCYDSYQIQKWLKPVITDNVLFDPS